jgi:hypothetical protein
MDQDARRFAKTRTGEHEMDWVIQVDTKIYELQKRCAGESWQAGSIPVRLRSLQSLAGSGPGWICRKRVLIEGLASSEVIRQSTDDLLELLLAHVDFHLVHEIRREDHRPGIPRCQVLPRCRCSPAWRIRQGQVSEMTKERTLLRVPLALHGSESGFLLHQPRTPLLVNPSASRAQE